MTKDLAIRNSTAEFLIFTAQTFPICIDFSCASGASPPTSLQARIGNNFVKFPLPEKILGTLVTAVECTAGYCSVLQCTTGKPFRKPNKTRVSE